VRDPVGEKWVDVFDEIIALGDKKVLEDAANANYQESFRTAANTASIKKAHDDLDDDNELNNFIIDQYHKGRIPADEAVEAYNHGWIYA